MDIQYTIGVATEVPVLFISVGPDNDDILSGFLDQADFLVAEDTVPQVLTTSYGFTEDEVEDTAQTFVTTLPMLMT